MDEFITRGALPTNVPGMDDDSVVPIGKGDVFDGRYRFEKIIGEGGMGVVWQASDENWKGRVVAIKVLKKLRNVGDFCARQFTQEIEALSKCAHPNIIPLLEIGTFKGHNIILMQYLQGKDLDALVKSGGPVPDKFIRKVVSSVCSALENIHLHNFVHRDIKPSNIFLGVNAGVYLMDFGLAFIEPQLFSQHGTSTLVGTEKFMPPEQKVDAENVSHLADQYSLAATIVALAIGNNFHTVESDINRMSNRCYFKVVKRALNAEPNKRFRTIAEFAREFDYTFGNSNVSSPARQIKKPFVHDVFAKVLTANQNEINDQHLLKAGEQFETSKVKRLVLQNTHITDEAIPIIVRHFPNIEHLNLEGCANLRGTLIKELEQCNQLASVYIAGSGIKPELLPESLKRLAR